MKAETWVFTACTVFFLLTSPAYWLVTEDWTGTSALAMTTLLTMMVAVYLANQARVLPDRPEDLHDAEIADGAGEYGFFPPYSWWPLWCGLCLAVCVLGVVFGWWLFIIGIGLGAIALSGWIFEYYRGEYAH